MITPYLSLNDLYLEKAYIERNFKQHQILAPHMNHEVNKQIVAELTKRYCKVIEMIEIWYPGSQKDKGKGD